MSVDTNTLDQNLQVLRIVGNPAVADYVQRMPGDEQAEAAVVVAGIVARYYPAHQAVTAARTDDELSAALDRLLARDADR